MENKLTPEQSKQVNKLGNKFLIQTVFNSSAHAIMLALINFILVMADQIFELSPPVSGILFFAAIFFVMRRMFLINKENHDRFVQEAKKVVEPK